jgi:hypothetical protein
MKPVVMVIENASATVSKTNEFDTVKEAQTYANDLGEGEEFQIYTLYIQGHRAGIQWTLQTDTGTNLRTVKKELVKKAPRSSTNWTQLEIDTLIKNHKNGLAITKIAKGLGRTYNATYCKLQALKKIEPKPIKAKKEGKVR